MDLLVEALREEGAEAAAQGEPMSYVRIRTDDDVRKHLKIGATTENQWIEFKAALAADTEEVARDVAQFSNLSGGTLVVGAHAPDRVLSAFVGVSDPAAVMGRLERITNDHLTPTPVTEILALRATQDAVIVVANIEPHPRLVAKHTLHRTFECVVRGVESKRYMTWGEVEARMGTRDRLVRLRLEQIKPDEPVALDAAMWGQHTDHYGWRVTGLEDDVVRLTRKGVEVAVPLIFVDAAYRTNEKHAAWIVSLSCCLMALSGEAVRVSKERMFAGPMANEYRYRSLQPAP